jgi:ATP-dependent DNA helicase RecQ
MQRLGAYRPNLRYEVVNTAHEPERREQLVRLMRELDGTGIVYASSVRQVDVLFTLLQELGFDVARDHRRLPTRQRQAQAAAFAAGRIQAMVATSAFDPREKRDTRFIVHYALPPSLAAYIREATRAGRDGKRARCVLFYDRQAALALRGTPSGERAEADFVYAVHAALEDLDARRQPVPRARLSQLAGATPASLRSAIAALKALGLTTEIRGLKLQLRGPQVDLETLRPLVSAHLAGGSGAIEGIEQLIAYAETDRCRARVIAESFGLEVDWERCGTCDNCRRRPEELLAPRDERSEAADTVPPQSTPRRENGPSS